MSLLYSHVFEGFVFLFKHSRTFCRRAALAWPFSLAAASQRVGRGRGELLSSACWERLHSVSSGKAAFFVCRLSPWWAAAPSCCLLHKCMFRMWPKGVGLSLSPAWSYASLYSNKTNETQTNQICPVWLSLDLLPLLLPINLLRKKNELLVWVKKWTRF